VLRSAVSTGNMQWPIVWRWAAFAESEFVEVITPRSTVKPAIFGPTISAQYLRVAANTLIVIIGVAKAEGNQLVCSSERLGSLRTTSIRRYNPEGRTLLN
jgi:hypothetical protein